MERLSGERARTGRPATSYSLTGAGDHLFPKHYDGLTVAMMDAVVATLGDAAAVKVLAALANSRVSEIEPALRDLSIDDRIAALRNWYLPADPYMESETTENGYRLVERNCPFLNTAMSRPALCSVTVNSLTRLLGFQVRREQKFQHGDGRCVFRVFLDEPVDSRTHGFQLESDEERVTV